MVLYYPLVSDALVVDQIIELGPDLHLYIP